MAEASVHVVFPCLVFMVTMTLQCLVLQCYSQSEGKVYQHNTFTSSSFTYPKTTLRMSEWRYIRVELPQWFSSMSVAIESDDLDIKNIKGVPLSMLPLICLRDGSLPIPKLSNTTMDGSGFMANISVEESLANVEHCYPMQKNVSLKLTNDQISPGVWYFGIFNGIGATRTQSKMINRGKAYSFSINISMEVCVISNLLGPYCNQTVEPLSCLPSDSYNLTQGFNETVANLVSCRNSAETSCLVNDKPKVYYVEVLGIAQQLTIKAKDSGLNLNGSNGNGSDYKGILMCFARHGAIPSVQHHDYNASLDKAPFVIPFPRVGRWYIVILPVYHSSSVEEIQDGNTKVCYSLELEVLQCPVGGAGLNCTWQRYMLQTNLRTVPFQSYYLPTSDKVSTSAANFVLESLLSNSTNGSEQDSAWTYFLMDVPRGAAGKNIHIRLTSASRINYEIYARFGGLPSINSWDYYYANKSRSSDGSSFFTLYHSSEKNIDFYILYIKEGIWSFGIRQLNFSGSSSKDLTSMSISLERCPNKCSYHGQCKEASDSNGLTTYSFCDCDRTHGGFDCGIQIVSTRGHRLQSIFLVASNAAAILPAYWSLRKKAFAEWVLLTSSGIASGLYHACDVGTWCILSYNVLQFMDFWLSFMAVVSTFIYLTTISESSKRTIQTAVAIITAIMALTKATRTANIVFVMVIGGFGLLLGWMMELSTKWRQCTFAISVQLNMLERLEIIKGWFLGLYKTLQKRFRWGILVLGFATLAMAATCWILETSETYWIWHSIWHVTIYTSSFLFLCSKAEYIDSDHDAVQDAM